MKNKFKIFTFVLLCLIVTPKNLIAGEPFIFNVTEIEILEDGNIINGYKGGTATSKDGTTISAENFFYNKKTNILKTSGNVKYLDKIKNVNIVADEATYFKNNETIHTFGNSKVFSESNIISATNLEYDKNNNFFKAKQKVKYSDKIDDITITTDVTAASFIKSGGASTEFLKADGTVDTNTYLTS